MIMRIKKSQTWVYFIVGLIIVQVIPMLYVLLGTNSYIQVHDQVDGEILNYIYQAKYFLKGDMIPEFMNGMSKAAMTPPAPFGVLFYMIFSPFAAYVMMQWFVVIVGFIGMYFLCKELGMAEMVCLGTSLLFTYMPFYPTYGLCSLGQPLLILCFIKLLQGKRIYTPLVGIVLYAGMSSLTLVGYVWICLAFLSILLLLIMKKRKQAVRIFLGEVALCITYVLTNLDLFNSMGSEGFQTHRTEMLLLPKNDFLGSFKELFFVGGSYSTVYSPIIFASAILVLSYCFFMKREKSYCIMACSILASIVVFCVLAFLWNYEIVVYVRKYLGGLFSYFQADRVYFIFPMLWMLILACIWNILYTFIRENRGIVSQVSMVMFGLLLFVSMGFQIFRDSTVNRNIRLLLQEDYEQVTWQSMYMEDVFEQIDVILGENKQKYSVVSLGMYPSIPLYHGYTCADGYSNNYDLKYKHEFRKIIGEEIEKDEAVKSYFDDWGNRLYLATAYSGFNAMISKQSGFEYTDLAYDVKAMKALNIRYIFAAAPIEQAEELGAQLIEGSPFSSEKSYYEVWLYDLGGDLYNGK